MITPAPPAPMRAREQAQKAVRELIKDYGELSVKKWGELYEGITAALLAARREALTEAARVAKDKIESYTSQDWDLACESIAAALEALRGQE